MLPWIYLVTASMFEAGWIYSLKFLDMKRVFGVRLNLLFSGDGEWRVFVPLFFYIVFGLCNIYFFSMAMKGIQASTAFAVWMAMALIFSKALDIFVFHESYNLQQLFFTVVLLVGIAGLKYSTKS